ncbi:MAG TPA: pirin family protein [Hyphomicrobiales bacterium]|nr:pirin family protein [Hyphomicrobiales bacterium]
MERTIDRIEMPAEAGANEQVQRKRMVVGPGDFSRQSPFLFLSEDWFAAPGGFETHPHRGMQTVTLMLDGALRHRDHTGADGVLEKGDVQWMTAGHGVLHSEMPHERETAHTLQLWLNLPSAQKMIPARYVDQRLADVPVRRLPGVEARIYAGRSGDIAQPHGSDWPMMLIDLKVAAGREFAQEIPASWRGFLYALEGSAAVGAARTPLAAPEVAWFEPSGREGDDTLTIAAGTGFRGLIYAGPPIDEPVVAYGPFVMNTVEEIRQAFADYQRNRFVA